jgi:hypothetical protein
VIFSDILRPFKDTDDKVQNKESSTTLLFYILQKNTLTKVAYISGSL